MSQENTGAGGWSWPLDVEAVAADRLPLEAAVALATRLEEEGKSALAQRRASAMWAAIAARPDLTEPVMERISEGWSRNLSAKLALARNPIAGKWREYVLGDPDMTLVLIDYPEEFAEELILLTPRFAESNLGDISSELIKRVPQVLGAERVEEIVLGWAKDRNRYQDAAQSPYLSEAGWAALLELLPTLPEPQHSDLISHLGGRVDISDEAGLALYEAALESPSGWILGHSLIRRACPKAVFIKAATGKHEHLAKLALEANHCPAEARWAAVRAHRPHALILTRAEIPAEIAHLALNDLDKGKARRRKIPEDVDRAVREAIIEHCADPATWERARVSLDGQVRVPADKIATTATRGGWAASPFHRLMPWMAAHPDPALRVQVVPYLLDGATLDAAAGDPDAGVRRAVARHDLAPGETLSRLAGDPEPEVRLAVSKNERTPLEALSRLAGDPVAAIRAVLVDKLFEALAESPLTAGGSRL